MKPLACCVAVSEKYGLDLCMIWPKSVDGHRFRTFLRRLRAKYPFRRMCVYLDNLGFHKSNATKKVYQEQRLEHIFNPPYSPFANPIEECFSVVKHDFKKAKLRRITQATKETDEDLIESALQKINGELVKNCVRHSNKLVNE